MSGGGLIGDKWHCVHPATTRAAGLSRGTTSERGMARSPPHTSYLSQPPQPAVVYFFQAGVPFSTENMEGTVL